MGQLVLSKLKTKIVTTKLEDSCIDKFFLIIAAFVEGKIILSDGGEILIKYFFEFEIKSWPPKKPSKSARKLK
jgi:hypothetical protein